MEPTSNDQRCKKYRGKTKENYKKNDALYKNRNWLMMKLNDSTKKRKRRISWENVLKGNERSWSWRHYKHLQTLLKQQQPEYLKNQVRSNTGQLNKNTWKSWKVPPKKLWEAKRNECCMKLPTNFVYVLILPTNFVYVLISKQRDKRRNTNLVMRNWNG